MKKALVIHPDGRQVDLGHKPELAEAQQICGGYIQVFRLNDGRQVIVDEEAPHKGAPVNVPLTQLCQKAGSRSLLPPGGLRGTGIVLSGWRFV